MPTLNGISLHSLFTSLEHLVPDGCCDWLLCDVKFGYYINKADSIVDHKAMLLMLSSPNEVSSSDYTHWQH